MLKRLFDACVSLVMLVALCPVLALISLCVFVSLGRPVIFRQQRAGLHGRSFVLYKFRTMTDQKNEAGDLVQDGLRLTPFGATMRKMSLDEFPQFINVLKGDMSLVGPRPLLMEYLPLYSSDQARRHNVRPGITGWAQINGRNTQTWEERFRLDIWYIENQSFWLDLKILCLTIFKVLARSGVSSPGEATMPRFTGNAGLPRHPNE